MKALILCIACAGALSLAGCGGNLDSASDPSSASNNEKASNSANSEFMVYDHSKLNLSPSTWRITAGTGNGFMAKAIAASDAVKGVTTDDGQGGVLVDAENLTPQSINAAKDALDQFRVIAIDSTASTGSHDQAVKALEAITGASGNFLVNGGQEPVGFVVVKYQDGGYNITPLVPDTATLQPNGGDNRVSTILQLKAMTTASDDGKSVFAPKAN